MTAYTRTICIPVDESKDSIRSIQFYLEKLANPKTDKVLLIHVRVSTEGPQNDVLYPWAMPGGLGYPMFPPAAANSNNMEAKAKSKSLLNQLAQHLGPEFNVKGIMLDGKDVKKTLVRKINELNPTIVLIAHGRRGLFCRAILGSVSKYLVNHSKSPVTLVPHEYFPPQYTVNCE